ncbi:hypothetical protein L0B53_00695 [Vibrio sp. SS-MA-C1-2]|uniref:hypothetical protein n=1 Tax=Vibrio sp. SS-MA-C1-2 TaxID=2908646 RepID=UPI001F34DA19|nr:hypothetical protein [Vibrio sp. SS-MA-C1-2]UJF17329.1 hypothetical protein L0B53_00695 [Vibrio sp. SS-MA-C1-2]
MNEFIVLNILYHSESGMQYLDDIVDETRLVLNKNEIKQAIRQLKRKKCVSYQQKIVKLTEIGLEQCELNIQNNIQARDELIKI